MLWENLAFSSNPCQKEVRTFILKKLMWKWPNESDEISEQMKLECKFQMRITFRFFLVFCSDEEIC